MVRIKEIRLKNYDYKTDGYYFVTAVCDSRNNFFKGKEIKVEKELKDLEQKTPGMKLDYFVIMPNHVHIIFILENKRIINIRSKVEEYYYLILEIVKQRRGLLNLIVFIFK
jgi:REP element-mobilizing transposase RayT